MDTYLMLFRCIPIFFTAIVILLAQILWQLVQIRRRLEIPKGWAKNADTSSKPQCEPGGPPPDPSYTPYGNPTAYPGDSIRPSPK